jgi:5'-methylthioadenosine phosphorylase
VLIPLADEGSELGAEIGVFGGSGFYDFLDDATDVHLTTPYGVPAGPVRVGTLSGRRVAFLARHGQRHQYAAHRVPYQANIWALASLGVRSIVAPCSVGALRPDLSPGDFLVLDQLVDRTTGRADTFHDVGSDDGRPGSDGPVHHQTFADPYHPAVRDALLRGAEELAGSAQADARSSRPAHVVHPTGTMVVINGPRFSTRAESRWFREMGWDVVNMTGYPEAVLAAEANVAYGSIALVTDRDAGDDDREAVTLDAVMAMVASNVDRVGELIAATVPFLP